MNQPSKLIDDDFKNWEMVFNREKISSIDKFNIAFTNQTSHKIGVKFPSDSSIPTIYWVNHSITPNILNLLKFEIALRTDLFIKGYGVYLFNVIDAGATAASRFTCIETSFTPSLSASLTGESQSSSKSIPTIITSKCSNTLRELGQPYGRTCQVCGLGPCTILLTNANTENISITDIERTWLQYGSASEWAEYKQTLIQVVNNCIKLVLRNKP